MGIDHERPLRVAVLSGKGGTGKTLVSVNLAAAAKEAVYIDCDVEEPNGHLFFNPEQIKQEQVTVKIPVVDDQLCNGCRICTDFCKFNSLAFTGKKLMVFDQICHSCGGCSLLCPQKALREVDRSIGSIQTGVWNDVDVVTGFLNPGEVSGVPIIKKIFSTHNDSAKPVFIDCPPGSACIVMESIHDADYCVLVTEPTLFGLHNLKMVEELVKLFHKPYGIVLNKTIFQNNPSEMYCIEQNLKILLQIPYDVEIGRFNSDAKILVEQRPEFRDLFTGLLDKIKEEAAHETASDIKR